MKKIFFLQILLLLFLSIIKCDKWYGLVTQCNEKDFINGYAGVPDLPINDFYLCGKRHYRIHFLGDEENNWSRIYENCEPVGEGRKIDGIAIDGNIEYMVRPFGNNGIWLDFVKTNDITGNNFTFAGVYGREIESVCIKGNDVYRVAAFEKSTHPKKVSERIIEDVFGNISTISNYTMEYGKENLFFINEFFNSTIQLLWTNETKLDGDKIKFEVERAHYRLNQTLTDIYWGGFINDNLNNKLKEIIGFDIKKAQNAFENMLLDAIDNGIMVINFFWEERKIQIDFGSRIAINIDNFRGGLRLNLYIKDYEPQIETIKNIIALFSSYTEKKERDSILNLLEKFNNIEQLSEIMKKFSSYNNMISGIIFLTVIYPVFGKNNKF